jgi:hypothetical protein
MLHALGRTVQTVLPEYTGPKLGVKVVERNVRSVRHLGASPVPPLEGVA